VIDTGEMAGRVLAVGFDGTTLEPETRRALERLRPGVVILFGRNVVEREQLAALIAALHGLPSWPLVAIDHEGGRVSRLGPPFTAFPTAAEIGRAGAAAARAVGEAIGRELASLGIDIDFAPVLDVGDAAGTSVIGDRAFGSEPGHVAELGVAFAAGLHAGGVLACGKHFPGHGGTASDSHETLPVITRSRAELDAIDLPPFRAAIAAGLPMLMTSHVLYPALDPERLATASPRIAGGLLRGELGFRGVLWSDDLTMRAITRRRRPADGAVEALAAGLDGVLICHDLDEAQRAAERVWRAVPAPRLRQAAARVAALRVPRRPADPPLALPAAAHAALAEAVRAMAAARDA
jgi:beta-N-acetylhexosaminidase